MPLKILGVGLTVDGGMFAEAKGFTGAGVGGGLPAVELGAAEATIVVLTRQRARTRTMRLKITAMPTAIRKFL